MQFLYAALPQGTGRQRGKIPVDNWEFSTFSTEFSTRVFHRAFPQGICKTVDIRVFPGFRLFSPFSAGKKSTALERAGKNLVLTRRVPGQPGAGAGGGGGRFPFSFRFGEKFLKKVLILWESQGIISKRMR